MADLRGALRGRDLLLVCAATVLMGIAFWPISFGAGAFFIYGGAMLGHRESTRRAARGVALIALLAIAEALLLRMKLQHAAWPVVFTIIVGASASPAISTTFSVTRFRS